MKLTALFLLATCLHVNATDGYGQKVTLSEREVHIEKIFTEIKKQTGYNFLYTSNILSGTKRVSVHVTNALVTEVLDLALAGQGLEYRVKGEDRLIIIKTKPPVVAVTQAVQGVDGLIDEVRGVITDENGVPASGVNVVVKGTSKGTTTNLRGEFVLREVKEGAVLLISSVGYDRQEMVVKDKGFVRAQLKVAVGNLDEMQVIGYGTTSKRFSTGNVASLKAADIEKQPVNNPLLGLQGRIPGMIITQTTGVSGGGVNVAIQGRNSILSGNDPLIIIDGVPFPSQVPGTGQTSPLGGNNGLGAAGSPLAYINPSDIESIDVLKDADATSIYGSRGANGVILITTKKGKVGKTSVAINAQQGIGKVAKKLEVLNTRQYLDMRYEAIKNDGLTISPASNMFYDLTAWDTTRFTDWQKVYIGGSAKYTNINTSISGGSNNIQYLVGTTFNRQTTVFPGDFDDKRGSVNFNINSNSGNKKLTFQLSGNYMVGLNRLPGTDYTQNAILTEPHAPSLYNEDGSLNWAPNQSGVFTLNNPLRFNLIQYSNKTNNLIANSNIGYHVLQGLQVSASFGFSQMLTNDFKATPYNAIRPDRVNSQQRSATYGYRKLGSWIIEPQLTLKRDLFKGRLDFLLGATIIQNESTGYTFTGVGYNSDAVLKDILSAPTLSVGGSLATLYKYNALFGRLNYNWQNKYIINLTARRDGSTRFGPENRFHNFGSAAIAWLFSNEEYLKAIRFISFGKLKLSYGVTGNDQIQDYSFMSLYSPVTNSIITTPYQGITGFTPERLNNPYLEWEENRKLNFGIDLGFLNDRILLSANFARNRSSNQLIGYALPSITGFATITKNFPATVQNTSWEFTLSTTNIKAKKVTWKTNFNLTIPKNKLLSFPNLETSTYANGLFVGKTINYYRLYNYLGVDPSTGLYMIKGLDGNPTSSPIPISQIPTMKSSDPMYYGGMQNTIDINDFQIDFLFQYVQQYIPNIYFFNGLAGAGQFNPGVSNQTTTVLDRWQKPGDAASIRKYSTASYFNTEVALAVQSDENYKTGSYIRLKNLSFSWRIPKKWIGEKVIQNLSLFLLGQNLLTITGFKGLDPETRNLSVLPPLRTITAGVKVNL